MCIAYAWDILYQPGDEIGSHISAQSHRPWRYLSLITHMLCIWATYAISSHAVAYRSIMPLIGPRLPSIVSVYRLHMLNTCATHPGSWRYLASLHPPDRTNSFIALSLRISSAHAMHMKSLTYPPLQVPGSRCWFLPG